MWRLTMCLLCLIAALSGTPLRQAEAADDFARSIAELGDGNVVETVDGGVGDDANETVLKAGAEVHPATASVALPTADRLPPVQPPLLSQPASDGRRWEGSTPWPTASPVRRHAWLQRFLF